MSARDRMTGRPFAPSLRWCWWRWRVSNTSQTVSRCRGFSWPLATIWSSINSTITSQCHHGAEGSADHWQPSDPTLTLQSYHPHHSLIHWQYSAKFEKQFLWSSSLSMFLWNIVHYVLSTYLITNVKYTWRPCHTSSMEQSSTITPAQWFSYSAPYIFENTFVQTDMWLLTCCAPVFLQLLLCLTVHYK